MRTQYQFLRIAYHQPDTGYTIRDHQSCTCRCLPSALWYRQYPYVLRAPFVTTSNSGVPVGAVISGRCSDLAVTRGRQRRQGRWVPEDRLLATIPGALFLIPASQLLFGLTAQFIPGRAGLGILLVCIFMNGLGVSPSGGSLAGDGSLEGYYYRPTWFWHPVPPIWLIYLAQEVPKHWQWQGAYICSFYIH